MHLLPYMYSITGHCQLKICDMGIPKLREASQGTVTTATVHMKGTYPYMAPEMYGPNRRGTAADVYAFGCLMIELFGQKKVWGELVTAQIMQKVCRSIMLHHNHLM